MATISVSGKTKKHLFSVIPTDGNLPKCPGIYFIVECDSNPYGLSMDHIKGMGTCANFEEHFKNHPLIKEDSKKKSYIYVLPEINSEYRQITMRDLEDHYKSQMISQRNNLVSEMSIEVEGLNRFLKKKSAKKVSSKK